MVGTRRRKVLEMDGGRGRAILLTRSRRVITVVLVAMEKKC